jgi:hypothetical protein
MDQAVVQVAAAAAVLLYQVTLAHTLENASAYALLTTSVAQWVVPVEILQDTDAEIQNQSDYAGLVAHQMHCSGAAATEELATVHGKATILGVGATEKLQVILKTAKQKASIGLQEDPMPQCVVQVLAVFAVMLDTTEAVCVRKADNLDTSNVQTAV